MAGYIGWPRGTRKQIRDKFEAMITPRYGPLPGEGPSMYYHDPEIYQDMYMRRYVSYVAAWRVYLNEPMGHYC
ncbi:hypothetical protein TIFTF001_017431 [Ficus carica]|uniref:Uncharacterized protein n=1 Tax=Ficus carica TaxID=3494 RepID=A0AA88DAR0_FICCA|nr:hypothetical protein TIFTF001_017431 [Ficus carica]